MKERARKCTALVIASLALLPIACRNEPSASKASATTPARSDGARSENGPRDEVHQGVRFLTLFHGGGDDSAPLVIGIHGRGGTPERFGSRWADFQERVEIALPQGFDRIGQGFSWFPSTHDLGEAELAAAIGDAEKRLWPAIAEIAHGRKVIVTGFSQGGILSYVLAARHPAEIAYAFPMSGGAPRSLLPVGHAPSAPVYALHGSADDVIDVAFARATVATLQAEGGKAELREFPNTGHDITPAMRDDLLAHVRAQLLLVH